MCVCVCGGGGGGGGKCNLKRLTSPAVEELIYFSPELKVK